MKKSQTYITINGRPGPGQTKARARKLSPEELKNDNRSNFRPYAGRSLVFLGGALFLLIIWTRQDKAAGETPTNPPPNRDPLPERESLRETVQIPKEENPNFPSGVIPLNEPAEPIKIDSHPLIPNRFQEDSKGLHNWLFQLPDEELAMLVGTKELGRSVSQVFTHLEEESMSRDRFPTEAIEFLEKINKRILEAQPACK